MPQGDTFALLIGAAFYFPNMTPEGGMFESLQGCARDIDRVKEEVLRTRLGVPEEHIVILKSSARPGDDSAPAEAESMWPTYGNIVSAMKRLRDLAPAGSQVYIHYSGHGGRATTRFPEVKGNDGIDEVIVPIDIEDVAVSRYLRDVELAHLLRGMVDKGLLVTLVLDSCHSGGMTREAPRADLAVRGSGRVDRRNRRKEEDESLVASHADLVAQWRSASPGATRSLVSGSGWLPAQKYVMLAACRQDEKALEYAFNGQDRTGTLTYWLLDTLHALGSDLTWQQAHDRIIAKIHTQFPTQTPQLEGDVGRNVFGLTRVPPVYAVRVLQYDAVAGRVQLNTGHALGAIAGATYAVYARGTADFTSAKDRLARASLADVGATTSWAKITEHTDPRPVDAGLPAVLVDLGVSGTRGRVRIVAPEAPHASPAATQALEALRAALANAAVLALVAGSEATTYQVTVGAGGALTVLDPQGEAYPNLAPIITIDDPRAADKMVDRLKRMYRYHTVAQIRNGDASSRLGGALHIDVAKAPVDAESYKVATGPLHALDRFEGGAAVNAGELVYLAIRNTANVALNVAVLDLNYDWSLAKICPEPDEHRDTWLLEAGRVLPLVIGTQLADGAQPSREILKVFATVDAASYDFLELPPMTEPLVGGLRSIDRTPTGIERLFDHLEGATSRRRGDPATAPPTNDWTVADVSFLLRHA